MFIIFSELPPGFEELPIEDQQRILQVLAAAMEDEAGQLKTAQVIQEVEKERESSSVATSEADSVRSPSISSSIDMPEVQAPEYDQIVRTRIDYYKPCNSEVVEHNVCAAVAFVKVKSQYVPYERSQTPARIIEIREDYDHQIAIIRYDSASSCATSEADMVKSGSESDFVSDENVSTFLEKNIQLQEPEEQQQLTEEELAHIAYIQSLAEQDFARSSISSEQQPEMQAEMIPFDFDVQPAPYTQTIAGKCDEHTAYSSTIFEKSRFEFVHHPELEPCLHKKTRPPPLPERPRPMCREEIIYSAPSAFSVSGEALGRTAYSSTIFFKSSTSDIRIPQSHFCSSLPVRPPKVISQQEILSEPQLTEEELEIIRRVSERAMQDEMVTSNQMRMSVPEIVEQTSESQDLSAEELEMIRRVNERAAAEDGILMEEKNEIVPPKSDLQELTEDELEHIRRITEMAVIDSDSFSMTMQQPFDQIYEPKKLDEKSDIRQNSSDATESADSRQDSFEAENGRYWPEPMNEIHEVTLVENGPMQNLESGMLIERTAYSSTLFGKSNAERRRYPEAEFCLHKKIRPPPIPARPKPMCKDEIVFDQHDITSVSAEALGRTVYSSTIFFKSDTRGIYHPQIEEPSILLIPVKKLSDEIVVDKIKCHKPISHEAIGHNTRSSWTRGVAQSSEVQYPEIERVAGRILYAQEIETTVHEYESDNISERTSGADEERSSSIDDTSSSVLPKEFHFEHRKIRRQITERDPEWIIEPEEEFAQETSTRTDKPEGMENLTDEEIAMIQAKMAEFEQEMPGNPEPLPPVQQSTTAEAKKPLSVPTL